MSIPFHDSKARIVGLRGTVDSDSIDQLIDALLRLDTERAKEIKLYISSPQGGGLADAVKVGDVLHSLRSKVTAVGLGILQGTGMALFAMAPRRVLLPGSFLSTADFWRTPGSKQIGLGSNPDRSGSLEEALMDHLLTLGPNARALHNMLSATDRNHTVFFTAPEAVKANLADRIHRSKKAKAQKEFQHGF